MTVLMAMVDQRFSYRQYSATDSRFSKLDDLIRRPQGDLPSLDDLKATYLEHFFANWMEKTTVAEGLTTYCPPSYSALQKAALTAMAEGAIFISLKPVMIISP